MKKTIILCLLFLMIISIVGCKKKNPSEDVYQNQEIDSTIDVSNGNDEIGTTEPVTEVVTTEAEIQTPVEDVYEMASIPVTFNYDDFEGVEALAITDQELLNELNDYIENFYFNYLFLSGVNSETGNVESDAMTLFALSYIMQYEYNELKFDEKAFTLHIPKDHVINIVRKYFHRQLDVFKPYEDLAIGYEDGIYVVKVETDDWDVELKLNQVEKLGDFTYKVLCDAVSKTSGRVKEQVEAIVDESQNGHVLINYHITKIEE